jgi:hypothetical protein
MEKRTKATTTQEDGKWFISDHAEDLIGLASNISQDLMSAYEHAKYVTKKYYKVKHFDTCLYCKTPCLRYKELCGPCDDLRELGLLVREYTDDIRYRKATVQERKDNGLV